jgi:hypothetical protein
LQFLNRCQFKKSYPAVIIGIYILLCPLCPSCPFQIEQEDKKTKRTEKTLFYYFLIYVTNDLEKQLETLSDEQLETLMNKILENYNH